ncbi:hypothetical protein SAMN04244548_03618 [Paracoccus pantotrophus]|nr:hypothetical protein SAMN04244548_03618 [Paracoccus pantotrophus]
MTFAFVARHRPIWPVSWMCEVLGVSRSGFHAWRKRPISDRAAHDAKFVIAIDKSFSASDRTYGARRVWRDVLEDGLSCGGVVQQRHSCLSMEMRLLQMFAAVKISKGSRCWETACVRLACTASAMA